MGVIILLYSFYVNYSLCILEIKKPSKYSFGHIVITLSKSDGNVGNCDTSSSVIGSKDNEESFRIVFSTSSFSSLSSKNSL